MPKSSKRPKLVNRGGTGLLNKLPGTPVVNDTTTTTANVMQAKLDSFPTDLQAMLVGIDIPVLDPLNCREHSERNMEALKQSLQLYGQRTPIVVNHKNNMVLKGNGTLTALRLLGWTKVAVVWVDDDELTAATYALADNRTSELASWKLDMVQRVAQIASEQTGNASALMPGWSPQELVALGVQGYTVPTLEEVLAKDKHKATLIKFSASQYEVIHNVVAAFRQLLAEEGMEDVASEAECIRYICEQWLTKLEDTYTPGDD